MAARHVAIGLRVVLLTAFVAGCATIIHGTTQKLGVASTPSGARVSIDQQPYGTTPLFADLSRKQTHVVRIEMPGYLAYETTVTQSASGWIWGNILFGGLIGLAVDALTGGMYQLNPEQISAELIKSGLPSTGLQSGLFVVVTSGHAADAVKVGQLQAAVP